MPRHLLSLVLCALAACPVSAAGLLVPTDGTASLAMRDHKVTIAIDGQVAVTRVEQTFHNPADRQLEATYYFPVPKGASVDRFSMWVDGKEVKGELVEADKARQVYADIVRKIQDPGLLEYMGANLLKLRVFPVPARGDQKIALSYTSVNAQDSGLVEYTYPLKADAKSSQNMEKFSLRVKMKADHAIQNVYSPTHQVKVTHEGDKKCEVRFEKDRIELDRDFQLYYSVGGKDIGLTSMTYRPVAGAPGNFMLLISPRAGLSQSQEVPRDLVFVMDTSGSMAGEKIVQAKKALKFCLQALGQKDRFALINFATTVNHFSAGLSESSKENVEKGRQWVDHLEATGGTAIDAALQAALDLRPKDAARPFTVVFFTDGQPTVGESDPKAILANFQKRNNEQTRVFTFGVGHDVNAELLDKLAEGTRAVSTYVKPEEDIEAKVSALYAKISHPVLTELKLTAGANVSLTEMYPPQLPDLFHGGQVVVLGKYTGKGDVALTLTGKVGGETKEIVQEAKFSEKTGAERAFVEGLWARRKVGYLLDQIREGGEKKELVDEVVALAKKHGIATPYTSYLVVPDNVPQPALRAVVPTPMYRNHGYNINNTGVPGTPANAPGSGPGPLGFTFNNPTQPLGGIAGGAGGGIAGGAGGGIGGGGVPVTTGAPVAVRGFQVYDSAPSSQPVAPTYAPPAPVTNMTRQREALAKGSASSGQVGVEFAERLNELRNQTQVTAGEAKQVSGKTYRQVNQTWTEDGCEGKKADVTVKAFSKAYFRLMELRPELAKAFELGKDVVCATTGGKVLAVSASEGKEEMSDEEIGKLFGK